MGEIVAYRLVYNIPTSRGVNWDKILLLGEKGNSIPAGTIVLASALFDQNALVDSGKLIPLTAKERKEHEAFLSKQKAAAEQLTKDNEKRKKARLAKMAEKSGKQQVEELAVANKKITELEADLEVTTKDRDALRLQVETANKKATESAVTGTN